MILFVGDCNNGFFLEETAEKINQSVTYTGFIAQIIEAKNKMADSHYKNIVIDIRQFIDGADEIANEIVNIKTATSTPIIIFAPGLSMQSDIITKLLERGISLYITAVTPSKQRQEYDDCISGQAAVPLENTISEKKQEPPILPITQRTYKTVSLCGACRRIGTTTQAVQIVKYLQFNGQKAAFIEMNNTGFVSQLARVYSDTVIDREQGKVSYKNIDFFYNQEQLSETLKKPYDYFVFDYGSADDSKFNAISFIEKDIAIIVCGSSPNEWDATNSVIAKTILNDAYYIFNFCDVSEQADIKELMEEKSKKTIFAGYSPDFCQFTADRDNLYGAIIKTKKLNGSKTAKKGLFGLKRSKHG